MAEENRNMHLTKHELFYISRIGCYHETVFKKHHKHELLRNYIEAAYKRTNWEHLNRKAIIDYAKECLAKA